MAATSDRGAVYASNYEFALAPIYAGRVGSHERRQPFLFFFDRHQNVYGTSLIGGMRDSYGVDNGYIFHLDQSTISGDTQPFSVAHFIMNVDPPIIYSLGDFTYGRLGTPFFEMQFRSGSIAINPASQNVQLQHVMKPEAVSAYGEANNGQLPCGFKIDSFDTYYELAVETEYTRVDGRYIRGETTVVNINALEYSPAIKTSVIKEIEDWTVYCDE